MRKQIVAWAAASALAALGCAQHSAVDAEWGNAQEAARTAQHADPEAPRSAEAAEGIDAVSSELVADRYYKGQRTQETRRAPAVVISEDR